MSVYVCVLGKRMIMAGNIPENTRVEFYLLKGVTEISEIEHTRRRRGTILNPHYPGVEF